MRPFFFYDNDVVRDGGVQQKGKKEKRLSDRRQGQKEGEDEGQLWIWKEEKWRRKERKGKKRKKEAKKSNKVQMLDLDLDLSKQKRTRLWSMRNKRTTSETNNAGGRTSLLMGPCFSTGTPGRVQRWEDESSGVGRSCTRTRINTCTPCHPTRSRTQL